MFPEYSDYYYINNYDNYSFENFNYSYDENYGYENFNYSYYADRRRRDINDFDLNFLYYKDHLGNLSILNKHFLTGVCKISKFLWLRSFLNQCVSLCVANSNCYGVISKLWGPPMKSEI